MGFVVTYVTIVGLSGLIPQIFIPGQSKEDHTPWIGLKFFLAATAIPLSIFVLSIIFDIGLRASAWTIAALSMVGAVRLILPYLLGRRTVTTLSLFHPIVLIPLAVCIVFGLRNGLEYIPINGLEVSGYLYDARIRFATDTWLPSDARLHFPNYTPAWNFFLLYPTLILDEFKTHAAAIPVLMHLGLLALIYDLVPRLADPDGRLKIRSHKLLGWITVLALLAIEAYWRLFPLHLVIALGQVYTAAAIFTILMAGIMDGVDRLRLSMAIGAIFALGYAIKVTGITLGFSLGVIWLAFVVWEKNDPWRTHDFHSLVRRASSFAFWLLAPGALIYLSWKLKAEPSYCLDSVAWYFQRIIEGNLLDAKSVSASNYFGSQLRIYATTYKFPVTLFGVSLIATSLFFSRLRWIAFAIVAWLIVYFVAVWIFYLGCGYGPADLSIGRYSRITLRPIHGLGIMLAVIFGVRWAISYFEDRLRNPVVSRSVEISAVLFVLAGGIWQFSVMASDIIEVGERLRSDAHERGERYKQVYAENNAIMRISQARKMESPSLMMIHQGLGEIDANAARLLSVNVSGEGPVYRYKLASIWRFHPNFSGLGVRVASEDEVAPELLSHEIIWPIQTDKWFRKILSPLLDSVECQNRPEDFFLFLTAKGDRFECIAKSEWVKRGE